VANKPEISIIIPVLDEQSIIREALGRIRGSALNVRHEVIVVDGSADAGTLKTIRSSAVRKVSSPKGRARQMNTGAKASRGDILLFLHADTELPPGGIQAIENAMKDTGIAGGAFLFGVKSGRAVFRLMETLVNLRNSITRIPYGDQAIFIRRDVFEKLGGFSDMPIMEDIDLMLRMKMAGHEIVFIPEKVQTSPRRWEREGILYSTIRNWTLSSLFYIGMNPRILSRFYR